MSKESICFLAFTDGLVIINENLNYAKKKSELLKETAQNMGLQISLKQKHNVFHD